MNVPFYSTLRWKWYFTNYNLSEITALKMDDIKKAPCGQAPLCSSESIMSNHVRTSFVLIITVAHQKIWALEIFGFSGVRKWYKSVCKTAIFQAKRLIFCVNTYFLILSRNIENRNDLYARYHWLAWRRARTSWYPAERIFTQNTVWINRYFV